MKKKNFDIWTVILFVLTLAACVAFMHLVHK